MEKLDFIAHCYKHMLAMWFICLPLYFLSSLERQYAISQLRIVRSGLHLFTYLDEHEICVQGFRFQQAKPICIINLRIGLACWNL